MLHSLLQQKTKDKYSKNKSPSYQILLVRCNSAVVHQTPERHAGSTWGTCFKDGDKVPFQLCEEIC